MGNQMTFADAKNLAISTLSPEEVEDLHRELQIRNEFSEPFKRACLELHYWQYGSSPTNFTSQLFCIFQKADATNTKKLRRGFPVEMHVFDLWNLAPTQDKFFEWVGLPLRPVSSEEWDKYKKGQYETCRTS